MALMRDGLWDIVCEKEAAPAETEGEKYSKFLKRRDRALAIIVLSVDPTLLYLLGEPEDPAAVWNKLADQFQKKTWANKLALRRKLYSLRLKDGDSVQKHIKAMIEIFDGLAAAGDPVKEEDRVVHLLASLPDSYSMLVTALEANSEVPKMEIVTERLLHEEGKLKEKSGGSGGEIKAMAGEHRRKAKGPRCHNCHRFGHIKKDCRELARGSIDSVHKKENAHKGKHKAHRATVKRRDSSSSDSDIGLVLSHALSASSVEGQDSWIVDSGATCHMCSDKRLFVELCSLEEPEEVTLGDGYAVEATGKGVVKLELVAKDGKTKKCKLHDVLYVPKLSYNLLSVSRVTKAGKAVEFNEAGCVITDENRKLIGTATRVGNLYYLNCRDGRAQSNAAAETWHRRYGHLGVENLKKLAKDDMVEGFDYKFSKGKEICEPCTKGKLNRKPFPVRGSRRSAEPLGLVHSDVCGKMSTKSLSDGEYFLTFIDDNTHYLWVYILKRKDEVFHKFLEWKAVEEKSTGRRLKILRTDNGGEYTSAEFESYLKTEGVRRQLTIPKTPEQNGVAERMNRTLVETVRSMLADAELPPVFWAEALSTAVYLRNRSPTKALKDITPYEAWTGEKPNVEHLRTFGCTAYAHVPKDERKKLDSKAKRCILLGYGADTKGYRLYDPEKRRVFYSRDVVFCEEKEDEIKEEPKVEQEVKEEDEEECLVEFDCHSGESETTDEKDAQPQLRRSTRDRRPPDYYGEWVTVANAEMREPKTAKDALACDDKVKWREAMNKELESLKQNKVWDLVELPKDRKPVGSKWVFKLKTDADGNVERYKARLVAQGYAQQYGLDYDETFCPVVRFESVRTVIAMVTQHGLKLQQMDVTTAFLNGELQEEVYMKQPEGFVVKGKEHLVCKLNRSIYGLKQSPRCWNAVLDDKLKGIGFAQTTGDPCIYTALEGEMFIIAVYVDDILLAGKSDRRMTEVKQALSKQFKMKDMGELHHFLGVKVIQKPETGQLWIGQSAYVKGILEKFGMDNSKPISTPVDVSARLVKARDDDEKIDQTQYQSAVGSLLFLSTRTRPDIAYAVSNVARFCAEPTREHWTAVKRILRYLNGTRDLGLLYNKDSSKECIGYSDADWAGDLDDRKSTSGYIFQMGGAAISWRSKKQTCVALSTAEAEYMALASTAQEAIWIRQLLSDLKQKSPATVIYEDNQSTICMTKNPQFHGRAKHIDIKFHFVREQVSKGIIELKYCKTEDMIADIFTKGLNQLQFSKLREMAGVKSVSG